MKYICLFIKLVNVFFGLNAVLLFMEENAAQAPESKIKWFGA